MSADKAGTIMFLICCGMAACFCAPDAFAADGQLRRQSEEHYQRGMVYYQEGRYQEAREQFEKAKLLLEEEKKKQAEAGPAATPEPVLSIEKLRMERRREGGQEYIISEGDVLSVKVWQNPDLDAESIVRPDGMISLPLIDDIPAAGFTLREVKEVLSAALKEFIRYPRVSVSISRIGGRRVIVLGQVNSPGIYAVMGRQTVLEAIGLAGGFTQHAVASSVLLVKNGLSEPSAKRLNLARTLKKGDVRDNVIVDTEDIIFVPKKFISDVNYYTNMILEPVSRGLFTARELREW